MRATLVLVALVALVAVALGVPSAPREAPLVDQALVDAINANGTFKAALHARFVGKTEAEIRGMMGVRPLEELPELAAHYELPPADDELSTEAIPAEFDAREKWPECAGVIGTIPDQSACGSCWAVSTASAMSDRLCIGTRGKVKTILSSIDIVGCCLTCGYGCQGGWPESAWSFGVSKGVVSGSGFTNDTGCKPYPFAECAHHSPKSAYRPCPSDIFDTPRCTQKCKVDYHTHEYAEDKTHFKNVRRYKHNVAQIQREIMTNGPVVFTYTVYTDFLVYTDGVYEHVTGRSVGGHAVRAIGWGTENGKDYWLISNSWNESWGQLGGYFKMIRGKNNCGIESRISAAIVDTTRLPSAH